MPANVRRHGSFLLRGKHPTQRQIGPSHVPSGTPASLVHAPTWANGLSEYPNGRNAEHPVMACIPSQPHAGGGTQWHPSTIATHVPRDLSEQLWLIGHAHSSLALHSAVLVQGEPTPPASIMPPGHDKHAPAYASGFSVYPPGRESLHEVVLTSVPSHAQPAVAWIVQGDAAGKHVPRPPQPALSGKPHT
jgi:hypothetical protein